MKTARQHTTAGLGSNVPCRESLAGEQPCTLRWKPWCQVTDLVEMLDCVEFNSGDELDVGVIELFGSGDDAGGG
jgi:hypothetical protein